MQRKKIPSIQDGIKSNVREHQTKGYLLNKSIEVFKKKSHLLQDSYESTLGSPADFAAFCLDVYGGDDRPPLPAGWTKYKSFGFDGYAGALYYQKVIITDELAEDSLNGGYNIIVAHKGTDNLNDVLEDIRLYFDHLLVRLKFIPQILEKVFDEFCKEHLKEYEGIHEVVHTGHSLGSIYADFFTAKDCANSSVTFENPGSKSALELAVKSGLVDDFYLKNFASYAFRSYLADVNVINTCQEHIGTVYKLNLPYDYYGVIPQPPLPEKISPSVQTNSHYIFGYTFGNQHKIANIYNYLKQGNAGYQITNHPDDIQKGYAAYLDYDQRKEYWDGYIEACWNLYPEKRIFYINNFEKFAQAAIKDIRIVHNLAKADCQSNSLEIGTNSNILELPNAEKQPPSISASSLAFFNNNSSTIDQNENIRNDIDDFVNIENDNEDEQTIKRICGIQ